MMPPDEYASYKDEIAEDIVTLPSPPTVVQADKSKWSLYMRPKDDIEVNYINNYIVYTSVIIH